jgi:transcriptional regulator with XRE-family HTH domain
MRIRERRIVLGVTQQELAKRLGLANLQAHRYERSLSLVSAGRLYEIARELNTPIEYFYEGVDELTPRQPLPHQRMLLDIARHFSEIQNERHQEAIRQLTRTLAAR